MTAVIASTDLSGFADRGGKLIMYDTRVLLEQDGSTVRSALRDVQEFYRLFMIPGGGHVGRAGVGRAGDRSEADGRHQVRERPSGKPGRDDEAAVSLPPDRRVRRSRAHHGGEQLPVRNDWATSPRTWHASSSACMSGSGATDGQRPVRRGRDSSAGGRRRPLARSRPGGQRRGGGGIGDYLSNLRSLPLERLGRAS